MEKRHAVRKPKPNTDDPTIVNVYVSCGSEDIKELIMALREDVQSGLDEVKNSLVTLTNAVNADNSEDASRIAELEAIIETLSANDAVDAAEIARLQAIVDEMNADSDALVTALGEVDSSIDTLTEAANA